MKNKKKNEWSADKLETMFADCAQLQKQSGRFKINPQKRKKFFQKINQIAKSHAANQ